MKRGADPLPPCHDCSGRELLKIDFLVQAGNSTGDPARMWEIARVWRL